MTYLGQGGWRVLAGSTEWVFFSITDYHPEYTSLRLTKQQQNHIFWSSEYPTRMSLVSIMIAMGDHHHVDQEDGRESMAAGQGVIELWEVRVIN